MLLKKRAAYFSICFNLIACLLVAQDIDRSVYSSGGKQIAGSTATVDYTIGEPIVFTGTAPAIILTQGFEQPDEFVITVVNTLDQSLDLTVFPNPLQNLVYLKIQSQNSIPDLAFEVINVVGERVSIRYEQLLSPSGQTFSMDLSECASGIYFLRISSQLTKYSNILKLVKE